MSANTEKVKVVKPRVEQKKEVVLVVKSEIKAGPGVIPRRPT